MNEYDKQANDFLKATNTTIEARFIGLLPDYFEKGDKARDIYEIKIKRGSREFIFKFGNSITDTEERIKANEPKNKYHMMANAMKSITTKNQLLELGEWATAGTTFRPSAYSILAGLTKYEPTDDIDDFASEMGYTKPSQAIKVYEAVKKEWQMVQALWTDKEIEQLSEIN